MATTIETSHDRHRQADAMGAAVVVGGRGFLGRAIVAELASLGQTVRVVDAAVTAPSTQSSLVEHFVASILDRDALTDAFAGADVVYHLAGKLGTSELDDDIESAVEVNVLGTVRLLEAATAAGVRRVFYPTKPNVWTNTYTITKHASERLAALYHETGRVEVPSLRYFNAFGPGQSLGPIRKIFPVFAALALRGRPLRIFGDGDQVVDMVYSVDLARLTVAFANSPVVPPLACDCGTGVGITVNEVAVAINEIAGNAAGIEHVPMRVGEVPGTELVADTADMLGVVGPFSFTPWQIALENSFDSYARLPSGVLDDAIRRHGLD